MPAERCVVLYTRGSSFDQKEDLARQGEQLREYVNGQESLRTQQQVEISDLGSGMNFHKKGLLKLLGLLFQGQVSHIVVAHQDRLMRFGFALIERICQWMNVSIVVIHTHADSDFTVQLTADLVEIITVFSSKLYGRRSAENKKLKQRQLLSQRAVLS